MRSTRQRIGWYRKRDQEGWVSGKPYLRRWRLRYPHPNGKSLLRVSEVIATFCGISHGLLWDGFNGLGKARGAAIDPKLPLAVDP